MALLVTFPAPRLVASRLLSGRSLRTRLGGRHHQKAFGLHARASAADKQAETKAQQQQQQTEKQAETQSPAPGTPFRRLGPLARGTQLSQLGGSSPMNLFSFVDQLANAMTDDLAAMMPFGHKDSVGTFPNHLAFPYDIVDKRSEYVITADIPGASKDMVEVSVDDDRVLHIVDERADRHEERGGSEADGAKYVVYNRSFGRFERNFQLPDDVEDGAIESTMKNGVLIVRVPKKKETIRQEKRKNARRISIKG